VNSFLEEGLEKKDESIKLQGENFSLEA